MIDAKKFCKISTKRILFRPWSTVLFISWSTVLFRPWSTLFLDPGQPLSDGPSTGVAGSRYGQGTPPAQSGLNMNAWEYGRGGTQSGGGGGSYYSPVSEYPDYGSGGPMGRAVKRSRMELEPDAPLGSFAILSEENSMLRTRVDVLNKQVADLTSA